MVATEGASVVKVVAAEEATAVDEGGGGGDGGGCRMRAVGGGAPIALAAPNIHCDVGGGYGRNHLDATTGV